MGISYFVQNNDGEGDKKGVTIYEDGGVIVLQIDGTDTLAVDPDEGIVLYCIEDCNTGLPEDKSGYPKVTKD